MEVKGWIHISQTCRSGTLPLDSIQPYFFLRCVCLTTLHRIQSTYSQRLVNWTGIQKVYCDTMSGIRFCGCGCGCQSEDPFVCFGAKPTQRACARDLPRDRKRTEQSRTEESRERKKKQQSTELGSRQNMTVGRREQELGAVDSEAGLANVRGRVSVPGGFVGISLEYTLALAHRCTESYAKCHKLLPSCSWS